MGFGCSTLEPLETRPHPRAARQWCGFSLLIKIQRFHLCFEIRLLSQWAALLERMFFYS